MIIKTSQIILNNVCFYAFHGVIPQEQVVGNEFYVSMKAKVDITQIEGNDDILNSVSYADIYQSIKEEIDIKTKTLEQLALRIINRLFNDFDKIERIEFKLEKRNPPMGAIIETAGIELICDR